MIPTRDRPTMTIDAIESVRAQTHTDWRLFVVDDASTDLSGLDTLSRYCDSDSRIELVRRLRPGGPAAARHTGFMQGTGSWVALLDSDDIWLPEKLERQLAAAGGRDVVLTWHSWIRPDGSTRVTRKPQGSGQLRPLVTNNMSTPLFARGLLAERGGFLGPFGQAWRTVEGVELFLRVLPGADACVVPAVLVHCRDHEGPRASDDLTTRLGAVELSEVIRLHRDSLVPWPDDSADLHCRAALRWAAAGDLSRARKHFADSLRQRVGLRTRSRVAGRFLPTYLRSLASSPP